MLFIDDIPGINPVLTSPGVNPFVNPGVNPVVNLSVNPGINPGVNPGNAYPVLTPPDEAAAATSLRPVV